MYDLVVQGGRVFDPGQGLDGAMDIGIKDGVIAAVQPSIDDPDAAKVMQLRGQLVIPGMIDMHVHIIQGAATPGVNEIAGPPDLAGVNSGVTTVLDAGTVGAWNFGVHLHHVAGRSRTRLLSMINIGKFGIPGQALRKPEIYTLEDVDQDATIRLINDHRDLIQGVKLRLVGPVVTELGADLIRLAKETAREAKVPLMVHIGDLIGFDDRAQDLTRSLLKTLGEGDIITHVYTSVPGGVLDANGKILPELREAQANGVVFDPAHGRSNFNFEVAKRISNQDFHPHTISTDLTLNGRKGPIHGLTETMSKFMAVGYSLEQVVRMVTAAPAAAVGMGDTLGSIAVGREADLSIIEERGGKWKFEDSQGNSFTGEHALVPVHTVRAGEMISLDWGPHAWGWEPAEA